MLARALAPVSFEASDLRGAAAAMLGAGLALPLLPGHAGLPCPLRTLTGVPCPLCGMTTSVEDALHLDLRAAAAANPGGLVVVAAAMALLVRCPARPLRAPLAAVVAVALGLWLFELHRFGLL
jgi:hypothetical protein